MKKQLFIQFVILDPQFVLHILWLWQGRHSLPYLSWRHVTDFLSFRILNNLRLSWKTELPWTALKYFLSFRVLEQLALVLKTEFDPEMFHCIEYTFYIQGYWATCACSGKQSLLWNLSLYWNIFYLSGFLRNLRLSWKQSLPRIFQARGAAAPPPASYATVNKHPIAIADWHPPVTVSSPAMSRQTMVQHFTFTSQSMQRFITRANLGLLPDLNPSAVLIAVSSRVRNYTTEKRSIWTVKSRSGQSLAFISV